MTRPEAVGETPRNIEAGVKEKDDFDETPDLCDFGYVLAGSPHTGPTPTAVSGRDGSA